MSYPTMEPTNNFRLKEYFEQYHNGGELIRSESKYKLQQLFVSNTGWKMVWQDIEEVSSDEPDVVEGKEECRAAMAKVEDVYPT